MRKKFKLPGFTMIELLVVIAVIGILSVALLSTLNPLEQIKKGRDTRTRADASQLASAIERYNASLGYFPWQSQEGEDLSANAPDVNFVKVNDSTATIGSSSVYDVLSNLTDTNEVKSGFIDRITDSTYTDMYLFYNDENTGASVTVCFTPESNTFSREAFDRCKNNSWGTDLLKTTGSNTYDYVYTSTGPCPDGTATDYAAASFDPTDANEMICIP